MKGGDGNNSNVNDQLIDIKELKTNKPRTQIVITI